MFRSKEHTWFSSTSIKQVTSSCFSSGATLQLRFVNGKLITHKHVASQKIVLVKNVLALLSVEKSSVLLMWHWYCSELG